MWAIADGSVLQAAEEAAAVRRDQSDNLIRTWDPCSIHFSGASWARVGNESIRAVVRVSSECLLSIPLAQTPMTGLTAQSGHQLDDSILERPKTTAHTFPELNLI
ncbi:hypothetical protein B5P45_10030 [Phyllobacterium zundukense]|uniref:Uncharacterized protein n=1 Tax=Phyllobacterium zundukense TaxID=1867719 RepID=A0A2N9VZS2_9HYPH|nr:hypothetical protein BLM14_21670 [Phyllobacterium zundukense]PIO44990.1 hypothetical protein B5P45_10030 [Phyllobacterium zundukense]